MAEKKQHKILLIEAADELRNKIEVLLASKGYQVDTATVSADGLAKLEASKSDPYTVIISSYAMPKMKGDEILKQAREMSPITQRILIANTLHIETMINSINKADIHSCLTLPFENNDLLANVLHRCSEFERTRKIENLKRVTQLQNKKMFQFAKQMKKKQALDIDQIGKKKKEVMLLESKAQTKEGASAVKKILSLEAFLAIKNTPFSPDDFGMAFSKMKEQIKTVLDGITDPSIDIYPIDYEEIYTESLDEKESDAVAKKTLIHIYQVLQQKRKASIDETIEMVSGQSELDEYLELSLSKDKVDAFIQIKKYDETKLNLTNIKQFLGDHQIIQGLIPDKQIREWLLGPAAKGDNSVMIARGKKPVQSEDAVVKYHFDTEFLQPGKVNPEDGRIDFKERGKIPFVKKGEFLAAKIFANEGKTGIDVTGSQIEVEEAVEVPFEAGSGTTLSEDGQRIYAETEGQPHLDAFGKISVFPELSIQGDVDYNTGNIEFDGNLVVSGTVKAGFKVKGASLIAEQVEGAEIDLSGDLNVSSGIIDAHLVNVKGTVQAKYVNNSVIDAFGDVIIQREIIDSKITIGGALMNETGSIMGCEISAKMGVETGSIGTEVSKPSKFRVGVDEHLNSILEGNDKKIALNLETRDILKTEITGLDHENQEFHATITKNAHIQDRSQLELKGVKEKLESVKASGNMSAFQKLTQFIEETEKQAKEAEDKINDGFFRQDEIAQEIDQKNERIHQLESSNKDLVKEKKEMRAFFSQKKPMPEVKVRKKVMSGTQVAGPNASVTLFKRASKCRIKEIKHGSGDDSGLAYYEMVTSDYDPQDKEEKE